MECAVGTSEERRMDSCVRFATAAQTSPTAGEGAGIWRLLTAHGADGADKFSSRKVYFLSAISVRSAVSPPQLTSIDSRCRCWGGGSKQGWQPGRQRRKIGDEQHAEEEDDQHGQDSAHDFDDGLVEAVGGKQ